MVLPASRLSDTRPTSRDGDRPTRRRPMDWKGLPVGRLVAASLTLLPGPPWITSNPRVGSPTAWTSFGGQCHCPRCKRKGRFGLRQPYDRNLIHSGAGLGALFGTAGGAQW